MRPNQQNPAIAAQIQQAVACHQRGDYDQAEALYKKVLAKTPRHFQALYLSGMLELHRQHPAQAITLIDAALKINPTHVDAQFDRATALEDLQRHGEALRAYDLVLALQSDFHDALFRRGNVLRQLQRHMEALDCYKRLLAVQPQHAGAWFKQGNSLNDLGRLPEALHCYERAVEVDPDYREAWFNLANMHHAAEHVPAAMAAYERALAIEPDFIEAIVNRAILLAEQGRHTAALDAYNRALQLLPDYTDALFNRAVTLAELQRYQEAINDYARLGPDDAHFISAQWNSALCHLKLGNFAVGWRQYEWRWRSDQMRSAQAAFAQPLWLGEQNLQGLTILLHAEQGFGDTIQFVRYAPLLQQQGARVIVQVQAALQSLLADLPGVSLVIADHETPPSYDLHCPLMSLPLACAAFAENAMAQSRYLQADAHKSAAWKQRLPANGKPRVGLVWAGSNARNTLPATRRLDAVRSMPFATLAPLINNTDADFYSLQLGAAATRQLQQHPLASRVIDHSSSLHDFAETAALIDNLDLVIAVDTAVAHLAAALGKPVCLLNRFNSCWRWQMDRLDSPWYPSMRLFGQPRPGDWETPVTQVRLALQQMRAP